MTRAPAAAQGPVQNTTAGALNMAGFTNSITSLGFGTGDAELARAQEDNFVKQLRVIFFGAQERKSTRLNSSHT